MPRPANSNSRGALLASRLRRGQQRSERAAQAGARSLPTLRGVTPTCQFLRPQENVLAEAQNILVESGRLYRYGNAVVMEVGEASERRLVTIATDNRVEPCAASLLANVFICEMPPTTDGGSPVQYPPPKGFVELLLNSEPTGRRLPAIRTYATRPVFDSCFAFCGNGWHAEQGILVHSASIEPVIHTPGAPQTPVLERLPPHLRRMLNDFCFRSDADVVNTVGAMLTGMMTSHFLNTGKGLVLLDGNQPGLGKTLLARVMGVVLDGADPDLIHYTPDDEELAKRLCATLRSRAQTLLLIDNAKVKANTAISSPVLEANSMAPQVSLRILGQSANLTRPNDLLWVLTMNDTKTSPDLVSRGLPIRLYFEGRPEERVFQDHDPIAYATEHRSAILGELAGMVVRWNQAGRPRFAHHHRCTHWASVIGGILQANGLPEFLSNLSEAAGEFSTALDELAAMAEAAIAVTGTAISFNLEIGNKPMSNTTDNIEPGMSAGQWEPIFRKAGVLTSDLDAAKSQRVKDTKLGNFLGQHAGREVRVVVGSRSGTARLCMKPGRSRHKLYYFQVQWDEPAAPDDAETAKVTVNLDDGVGVAPDAVQVTQEVVLAAAPSQEAEGGNQEAW